MFQVFIRKKPFSTVLSEEKKKSKGFVVDNADHSKALKSKVELEKKKCDWCERERKQQKKKKERQENIRSEEHTSELQSLV